jgi:hypothetical protein
MPMYRLYCLHKGRITKGDWLEADDEPQAIEAARAQHPESDCEVWLGNRLIARIPAGGSPTMIDD